MRAGIDMTAAEGTPDMPYPVPNMAIAVHPMHAPVPVGWWRSVGHTHTAQVVEVMIDDLALAAGKDPVEFRLALLDGHSPRNGVGTCRRAGGVGPGTTERARSWYRRA